MSSIVIKPANTQKEILQFIKLQWKFYKNDPHWVPPLISDRKNLLNKKKNPFYKHADLQCFVAEKDGELVGRIAAIKNVIVEIYPTKVFFDWMKIHGKEGGANKFPRVLKKELLTEWENFLNKYK